MAGVLTDLQKAYKVSDPISQYAVVVQDVSKAGYCKLPVNDNDMPLGIVDNDEQANVGKSVAVKINGYGTAVAGGDIAVGDALIVKAGGSVLAATSLAAGAKANIIGFAENGGAAGDYIVVRIAPMQITIE